LLSIIDRLCQDDLPVRSGPVTTPAVPRSSDNRYLKSVKRDVEWLFNTRQSVEAGVDSCPELASSVYAYGLPDITALNPTIKRDQETLRRVMQRSVEIFDRRLKDVQIEVDLPTGVYHSLDFRISGVLMSEPAPEEICFDTVLGANGKYEVK